jgi:NADH:ubiquinone oxidoreductase subunit 4 (subunit M)
MGLHGAVMHMIGQSLSTTVVFLLLNAPTTQGSPDTNCLAVPKHDRFVLAIGLLSAIGIPGLVGFIGQGTLILGILRWHWQVSESAAVNGAYDWIFYALIAFGLLVGMWALLRAWQRVPQSSAERRPSRQAMIALPVAFLIVFSGLYPSISSDTIGPAVHRLLSEVNLGMARDLLQMTAPAQPGENWKQLLPLQNESGRTPWILAWNDLRTDRPPACTSPSTQPRPLARPGAPVTHWRAGEP